MSMFTIMSYDAISLTLRAAGVSRRQIHNIYINVKILEFGDYIWNHHEKCSQISIPQLLLKPRKIMLQNVHPQTRKKNNRLCILMVV